PRLRRGNGVQSPWACGPGGQHQNKTASAVRAVHKPTRLTVVAQGTFAAPQQGDSVEASRLMLKLNNQLTTLPDAQQVHSGQSRLERGRPIRTSEGKDFRPR